jgi:EAL domain-containing protein (putative c-di-GMP-specific phosphodiesterase class I)
MGHLVDLVEAQQSRWLELWYQPKIDARAMVMLGAEGLLRVRHPSWGILPPAYFIASDGDPRRGSISEFVIRRAIDDWHLFFGKQRPVEIAINLPMAFLRDSKTVDFLCQSLPDHVAFEGLIIEINGTDVVRNLALAIDVANALRSCKIALSLDDVGAEWTSLTGIRNFPFVEIKVDQSFIKGCARDVVKKAMCRQILDLANDYGARTVAEGIETWADFLAARELGFDALQGFLFAKPASAEQFAQTCWTAARHWPPSTRSLPEGQALFRAHTNLCSKRSPQL